MQSVQKSKSRAMNEFTRIVLCLCGFVAFSEAVSYCNTNLTLDQLPGGIREELLSLIINGSLYGIFGCPENNTIPNGAVKFWLFNRNNSVVPILLDSNNPVQVISNKPTIFLIHGWVCNITDGEMPPLIAAYLRRYDCNLIAVDWSQLSVATFVSAYCSIPKVAQILTDFLCTLKGKLNIGPETVHVLGHSFGAQIAGLAGQLVKSQCHGTIMRITGLDPAMLFFEGKPISERLDKSDASFVDVIHTNMGILGYYGPCGHKDFFPNCGSFQPRCMGKVTSVKQLLNLPVSHILCDHFRANVYMAESVNSSNFKAVSCKKCPGKPFVGPCIPDFVLVASHATMGENSISASTDGMYFLTTNSQSPFARG